MLAIQVLKKANIELCWFLETMNLICLRRFDRRRENLSKRKNRFKNMTSVRLI